MRRSIRSSIGGWVEKSFPMNPDRIGIIKNAFISDWDFNSPPGGNIEIPVEIFRSAEANAAGFWVIVAAPLSAANSLYRESALIKKNERIQTANEIAIAT